MRQQVSLERVLAHLGLLDQLRGSGLQRRGCCPVHSHPTFQRNPSKEPVDLNCRPRDAGSRKTVSMLGLPVPNHRRGIL